MENLNNKDIFEKEQLSLWLKDGLKSSYPKLEEDESCDVCVIGAGITGITTAYLLSKDHNVILLDRHAPLHMTTGNTTAKVTFQHGLNYQQLIASYGENKAKLYYQAQVEGMELVKKLIKEHNIDCDFKEAPAMVYAETEEKYEEILKEAAAYDKLKIPYQLLTVLPYGLKGVGGIKVFDQIQLDPVKYLDALLQKMGDKVKIYSDTAAIDIEEDTKNTYAVTLKGDLEIICKNVVVATGYPFFDKSGAYYSRLKPYRSYLVSFPIEDTKQDDMMLISNSVHSHSMRFAYENDQKYLLVGGGGHKVGSDDSSFASYEDIIEFGKEFFAVESPNFRWSSQDYVSVDRVPYIGKISRSYDNVFVATGFKKWGMTNGAFAGILIKDLIDGKESLYNELFDPQRKEVTKNIGSFIKSSYDVAKQMIHGKAFQKKDDLEDINNDMGGIIKYKGKKVGAYRDNNGKLFLVDTTCTHMGCELEYNDSERTFDCPCHGSRFNYNGDVIEGPAVKNLKKIDK